MEDNINDSSYTDGQELQASDLNDETKTFPQKQFSANELISRENENVHEDNLYNEIMNKLDIVKKSGLQNNHNPKEQLKCDDNSNKYNDSVKNNINDSMEKGLKQDFDKIQKLVKAGLINSKQGQNLKKEVIKKAFDKLVKQEKVKRNLSKLQNTSKNTELNFHKGFEEFSQNNPNFFNSNGRKEVLNYLKSGNVAFGKDEFSKISEIVRIVEKSAIDRFLQKVAHEKTLRSSNENAKQKLKANAQKTGFSGNFSRSFTREQIGKMSPQEFAKYESAIMEALKKGQIK